MNQKMGVISPEGLQLKATGGVSRQRDALEGKTIGEVYNNHFKGEPMFYAYRRLQGVTGLRVAAYLGAVGVHSEEVEFFGVNLCSSVQSMAQKLNLKVG